MIQPHPKIHKGTPCVGAGDWPISHILTALTFVETLEDALSVYPGLTKSDVRHALEVAARVMQGLTFDGTVIPLAIEKRFIEEKESVAVFNAATPEYSDLDRPTGPPNPPLFDLSDSLFSSDDPPLVRDDLAWSRDRAVEIRGLLAVIAEDWDDPEMGV